MQYSQGQIKDLALLLSEKITTILEHEDPSELVPSFCCLMFLLEKMQDEEFFGDIVIPLRGTSCKEPYINNQTFRMRQKYIEELSKIGV